MGMVATQGRNALRTHVLILVLSSPCMGAELLVEAEAFQTRGGWTLDAQFIDTMGSPYLLAHGLGNPVDEAQTTVEFPGSGTYQLWVRTRDWVPSHHPGRFHVAVNDKELPTTFGTVGEGWTWQDGGTIEIRKTKVTLGLRDLTGFDGRCDALYFTTKTTLRPPNDLETLAAWRRRLLDLPSTPERQVHFDLVVIGGGIAGCSAAVTAARLGLEVALVQNRPVLGGNASPEIGIHPAGFSRSVVDELVGPEREAVVGNQQRLRLYLGWHVFHAETESNRIASVDAKHTSTGEEARLAAPVFIDCTGDAAVGFLAGAEYRMGREGREEFDESLAPAKPDKMTHGATLFFKLALTEEPCSFPKVPWATEVSQDHIDLTSNHTWEFGHHRDMIGDAEEIRDHLLRAIYGTFATVKEDYPKKASRLRLERVNHVAARGESRRLMGDYLLNENDIREQREFPDAVAAGGLVFCLHYPGEEHDFRNRMELIPVKPYGIPFRCLYSRNIENLMMAGRNVSSTHIGYSSTKLMKTGGQMGVAVGAAAALCDKHNTIPRGVYDEHLDELKDAVYERGAYTEALKP
jgi:FAD-dependent oxidoreductase family protein/FAD binding domain-containing protein